HPPPHPAPPTRRSSDLSITPPPSLRSPRSLRVSTRMNGKRAAYSSSRRGVSSREPSSTMIHSAGSSDCRVTASSVRRPKLASSRSEEHTSELQSPDHLV